MYLSLDKKYLYKKIYDEVTEDILIDMSNVRILKKKLKRKNGGCLYIVVFGQLSSVKRLT